MFGSLGGQKLSTRKRRNPARSPQRSPLETCKSSASWAESKQKMERERERRSESLELGPLTSDSSTLQGTGGKERILGVGERLNERENYQVNKKRNTPS